MKFCDKLAKLRKQNNITQEQLAERMGLSRQAVSKWELGVSIPDMEKILELCNILNCNLDELLDDGVIGETKGNINNKINFNNYFQDFLKYITNTYNMFYSMKFKQKIKCLLEMSFIFLVLLTLLLIIYQVVDSIIINNIILVPILGNYLYIFLNNIVLIAFIIIGVIIFFHLFKIRYLDYYITIEDKNTFEKTIEVPIDVIEKSKREYVEKHEKEKIIIRDPKHSTFSFFEFLSKILLFITKMFDLVILLFVMLFFIFLLICFFFLIFHLKYGIIFLYLAICMLGILLVTYIFIELFYNFLISKKQHFKRIFIITILGFIVFGFGFSASVFTYLNFDSNYSFNNKEKVFELELNDYTILNDDNYFNMNANYVIDNEIDNIKVEVSYPENMKIYLNSYKSGDYKTYLFFFDFDFFDSYKVLLDSIKKEKVLNLNLRNYHLTIYLSEDNYQRLIDNKERYEKYINTVYMN